MALTPPSASRPKRRRPSMGRHTLRALAAAFLVVFVVLPILAVARSVVEGGWDATWAAFRSPVARSALLLTLWTGLIVAAVNAVMGTLTAWVLVRHRFPGRSVLNAVIDLPFAIPTLVTGVMLVALYGPQQLVGQWFAAQGIRLLFAPPGIVLALLFVTFPFVVRAVEPVLLDIDADQEEAALTLGSPPRSTFIRIVLPALSPALLTSSLLTFTRALGEFGSVVIVAGNIPRRTLTAPVYVFGAIESGEPAAASAMSLLLIGVSGLLIFAADAYGRRRASLHGLGVR